MTTDKQLEEYIEGFNKKPGNYTKQEILKIGVKFKELPLRKRSWEALIRVLGLNLTPSALRNRVLRYEKSHPGSHLPKEEGLIFKNDYIEKQKVRDWYNAYRRDIREEVRIENLKDELIKSAEKFKDLPIIEVFQGEKYPDSKINEAVLLFSDLHLGVKCENYYNKYNLDIAKERVTRLVEKTIEYCNKNKVATLHFLNMGDVIQGLIHTNSRIESQMDVSEEIIEAGEIIAEALNELQRAAPVLTYRSVFDNHSRAVANLKEHVEKEQFSKIIDWFIEERLKDSRIQFIENDIDGGIGRFKLKNTKTIIFAHGHQDNKNGSFQNMIGLTKEWVDYILLAHYHSSAVKEYEGCKVFINGSIVGTESYAFGRRLFSKPTQKLLLFNTENNDVCDIDIALEK